MGVDAPINPWGMSDEWWRAHRREMMWLAKVRKECILDDRALSPRQTDEWLRTKKLADENA
jgi:hypothetical protein